MKLKKIVSLFAVIAMMASFVVSASANVTPSIEVTTENIEEMADNSAYPAAVAGYTRYLVSYKVNGLTTDYIDANGLTGLQVKYTIDEGAENVNAKTFKAKDKGKNSGVHATFENCGTTLFQEGFFAIASTDGLYYDGTTSLIDTVWYVAEGKSVTFSYVTTDKTGMYLSYGNWDAIATDTTDYYACEGNLPMNKTTITLGAAEEPKTTLGNAVAGNDMYGQKTIAAGISFATGSESKATVTLMNGDAEVESKEYSLPGSGVAGGTTNLVGIIRYNPEDVTAGNAFKLTVGEVSTTAAIN